MDARSRQVRLAGLPLDTPLLIPSVSSRGFPLDKDGFAQSNLFLKYAVDSIDEALLVSAYDLEHRKLVDAEALLSGGGTGTALDRPRLLVVDSGGYETGESWESGHVDRTSRPTEPYDSDTFAGVVDRLPLGRPLLVVSYDGPDVPRGSYADQIGRAQAFFAARPHLASDILLKRPTGRHWHTPRELVPAAPDLSRFDVIGFTEVELGDSLLDRLTTLAELRQILRSAGVVAPIHLFGALDPLFTPLYFAAGAEIFDGLSWMRYVYWDGLAVHADAGALLRGEDDDTQKLREAKRPVLNLGRLRELKRQMQRYAAKDSRGFDEFGDHGKVLSNTYATMLARAEAKGN